MFPLAERLFKSTFASFLVVQLFCREETSFGMMTNLSNYKQVCLSLFARQLIEL